jgi:signal transduction histidine kinase
VLPPWLKNRVFKTSAFRLAMQAAVLSLAGAVIIFVIIYKASEGTVRSEIERTASSQQADVLADTAGGAESMVQAVTAEIATSPGTFYAVGAPNGDMLGGNLPLPPGFLRNLRGWRTLTNADGIRLPPHVAAVRGITTRLLDGEILFVGESAGGLIALDRLILHAFLAVIFVTVLLGLAGGLFIARASLTRVEAISAASRRIMAGDFSRRIALNGSDDEFDHLAASLNAMLARIQALMENLKQVTNDIAHDLRSPLARLRERLELAHRETTDPAMHLIFDEAIAQVDVALNIFGAMLRIAEIEAGARRRGFAPVDLSKLLTELAETFEAVAEANHKQLAAAITPGLAVHGDQELLTQMFANLIENAIQHTPPWANISLHAETKAGLTEICVADNGLGIPEHERARVLQRFVRLDTARHSAGNGLGLALAAAVAELHGYSLRLDDNAPGLRAILSLPATALVQISNLGRL